MSDETTSVGRGTRGMLMAEKVILGAIFGGAVAIGGVSIAQLIARVVALASDATLTVPGIPLVDFPAETVSAASPQIESAGFDSLTITADGLSGAVRAPLIAATILGALVTIGICAVVAWLCLRILIRKPFVRSATWGIGIVAILVLAAGMLGGLLEGVAHAEAAESLGLGDVGVPVFLFTVDLAPLGWGLALAVVAGAFEIGQRMQRETEGLI